MVLRKIIHIDQEKCDGCGLCVKACHEGAIEISNGKARLKSESYCDGLGDCLGECPQAAISIEERQAPAFDEAAVQAHLAAAARPRPGHPLDSPCARTCPAAAPKFLHSATLAHPLLAGAAPSALANWPVQLRLAPLEAPYYAGATLLLAADCVPFAMAGFHEKLLAGRTLLVGCPKLDDAPAYLAKLTEILRRNEIQAVEVAYMEVPCCKGLSRLAEAAVQASGKALPLARKEITLKGGVL